MSRGLVALLVLWALPGELRAQASRPTPFGSAIETAMRLGNAAQLAAARAMIDSVVAATPQHSPELAEALFARATLAQSVLDATLDYEKIVGGLSTSPRREKSLLRLAQRALISGDDAKAVGYLRIIERDYPSDSSQAKSGFWTAAVLLEEHEIASACEANHDALIHARAASFMMMELEAQAKRSCPGLAPSRKPSRTIYAVQVAAYGVRAEAEEMSQRLRKTGLDAHVDGEVRPFRVRVGRFPSLAEASKALNELKARKIAGFVTELEQ